MAPVQTLPRADGGRPLADIVDVFAPRATPAARQERPALFAARARWAATRLRAEKGVLDVDGQPTVSAQCCGGVFAGDRVLVDVAPGVFWRGTVLRWERDALPLARFAHPVAVVRLDPCAPPVPPALEGRTELRRARSRLIPISED